MIPAQPIEVYDDELELAFKRGDCIRGGHLISKAKLVSEVRFRATALPVMLCPNCGLHFFNIQSRLPFALISV
jgi:hypothetical protein